MSSPFLADLFAAAVDVSWRASWLVLALVVLRGVLRGRVPAQVWFLAWIAVAVRLLLPFSVPTAWSPFGWGVQPERASVTPLPTRAGDGRGLGTPSDRAAVENLPAGETSRAAGESGASAATSWQRGLIAAWLAGVAGIIVMRVVASVRFRRALRRARPMADPRVAALLAREPGARGITAVETEVVDAPALFGIFRPQLLFPPGLAAQLNDEELRLVLQHELGHWRRRDLLAQGLVQAATAVHWFNPLAWITAALARMDCELACDEFVLRREPATAGFYGTTLLKVFGIVRSRVRRPVAAVGILETRRQLAQRVRRIADYQATGALRFALSLLALGALALASGTRAVHAGEKPAPLSPTPVTSAPENPPAPIEAQQQKVDELARALQTYKEQHRITSLDQQSDMTAEKLKALNAEALRAQLALTNAEARSNQMKTFRASGRDLTELPFVASQPLVVELKKALVAQRMTMNQLGERYAERHPVVVKTQNEIAATEAELARAVDVACRQVESEHEFAAKQLEGARRELARHIDEAMALDRIKIDYEARARELRAQERALQELAARRLDSSDASPRANGDYTISIVGAVNRQGAISFSKTEKPIVLDVIARAGGFAPNADLAAVRLIRLEADGTRSSQVLPEDVVAGRVLTDGLVRAGDLIVVPEKSAATPRRVSVSGQVASPGRFALPSDDGGRTTIVDAIMMAGGPTRLASIRKVRVSRPDPVKGELRLFVVDLGDVFSSNNERTSAETQPFYVQAGDIVFVPEKIL